MFLLLGWVVAGVSVGFLFGVLVAWRVFGGTRPRRWPRRSLRRGSADRQVDDYVDRAAEAWARANGVPAAVPLVASKLRLFRSVEERRARRAARGWWP